MAKKRGTLNAGGQRQTSENKQGAIKALCAQTMKYYRNQKDQVDRVDAWTKGEQYSDADQTAFDTQQVEGRPFMPRNKSDEVGDLATRAPAPWGRLIISSLAQTIYWESARLPGADEEAELDCFKVLQANRWGSKQIPHTRSTIGHGISYVRVLPAVNPLNGEDSASVIPLSARRVFCSYDEAGDEWPAFAIEVEDISFSDLDDQTWTNVRFTDDHAVHMLKFRGTGDQIDEFRYVGLLMEHGLPVCPYVRYSNMMDLEDNATGEIAPIIPLLRRIDQDTFDRLVVQRFGAWKVRYASGLIAPETDEAQRAQALKLRAQDMLIAEDPDTNFGTLDETPLDGFISATDADLRVLAAVTQTPPHHLLGLSSNVQAEALAATESGLQRKSTDYKVYNSESNQQLLRLIATVRNNEEEASAPAFDIHYRDTESRSLVQAASALTQLAQGLGVPTELLWERIPDWTDEDTRRAKDLIENGALEQFFAAAEGAAGQGAAKEQPLAQGHNGATAQE